MTFTGVSSGYHNLKPEKNHLTEAHLHVSLAGADSPDYHSEWCQQVICFTEKLMKYSKAYQTYLVLPMTFNCKV